MGFPKFKLNQDFYIESEFAGIKSNNKIFEKGKEFSADENGIYIIEWFGGKLEFSLKKMREAKKNGELIFEEIKTNYDLFFEDLSEEDENEIKNWRIQLDVKTTKKKLKEIESLIREHIIPYI